MKVQSQPEAKIVITHSGTDYTFQNEGYTQIVVRRNENGFDTATVYFEDTAAKNWQAKIDKGDAIAIYQKDRSNSSWVTLLKGMVRLVAPFLPNDLLRLECDGAGYGFGETVCGEEYGVESSNSSLDTIKEILTDATYGVVPKWVNKILGSGTSSGYSYDSTNVETITGAIKYVAFPYKPNHKVVGDLCDLVTAIKAGSAGPHWIVDTDDNFRLKTIGSTGDASWTKYYGGSQAEATLEQGKHLVNFTFQQLAPEANYILYYGILRKPAADYLTEGDTTHLQNIWGTANNLNIASEGSIVKVGSTSLKTYGQVTAGQAFYPSTKDAGWDFTQIGSEKNPPTFEYYNYIGATWGGQTTFIALCDDGSNYFYKDFQNDTTGRWNKHSRIIGPYYRKGVDWDVQGSPSWTDIDYILIYHALAGSAICTEYWDDMHFEGLICRGAKDSTQITSEKLKTKVIIDDVGKDDSMTQTDDSGTIARLAYVELLRRSSSPLIGSVTVPIIPDLLPGQFLHTHAKKKSDGSFRIDKDMRVTRAVHNISMNGFTTNIRITDDLTNSHPRSAFNDMNKVLSDMRPEWQDRQATNIKAGSVDLTVAILETDYPS